MLQSLRTCAISIATASLLASGLRAVIAPAAASSAGQVPGVAAASVPVHYLTSGPNVVAVELTLPDSARTVKVRLRANGSWYSCAQVGTVARCETPGQTVRALEQVEIANA
jgi:hypothetical protein